MSKDRLAVPILVILILLLAGVAWAFLGPIRLPIFASKPTATDEETLSAKKKDVAKSDAAAKNEEGQASFDITRIDREGTSVLAGRAEPGSSVTILEDDEAIGTVQADENGDWSFATEHEFASNDPNLALTTQPAPPAQVAADAKPQKTAAAEQQAQPTEPQKQAAVPGGDAPAKAGAKAALAQGSAQDKKPEERSAKTATARMLQDLESMVESARQDAKKEAETASGQPSAAPAESAAAAAAKEAVTKADAGTPKPSGASQSPGATAQEENVATADSATQDSSASQAPVTEKTTAEVAASSAAQSEGPSANNTLDASDNSGDDTPAPRATSSATATEATPDNRKFAVASTVPKPRGPDQSEAKAAVAETKQEAAAAKADVTMAAVSPSAQPASGNEGAGRKSVPVPITFVFNESTFTEEGRRAASLLQEYLTLKRFPTVSLTGHADERGSDELNMELSRERLETVARYLKEHGFKGDLDLIPKGESQPYTGVDRSEYPRDELYQLDRRVELLLGP